MAKARKGDLLSCEVCGLIVTVDEMGLGMADIVCCKMPLAKGKSAAEKAKKKTLLAVKAPAKAVKTVAAKAKAPAKPVAKAVAKSKAPAKKPAPVKAAPVKAAPISKPAAKKLEPVKAKAAKTKK